MVDYVQPLYWDEEAKESAIAQARQLAARDPEAASLLVAQVVAEQELQQQNTDYTESTLNKYSPITAYERACKEYGWKPKDIDEMHYITFFAMLREANERHKQENEAYKV